MTENTYTYIDDLDFYVCNDCGSGASKKAEVQHYDTCKPGDAQRWADYYNHSEEYNDEEYVKLLEGQDD